MTQARSDFPELIKEAEEGKAVAQNILGARYVTGDGAERDVAKGVYWYRRACKQGYTHALWNLGSMLVDGDDGTVKNEALGMKLIELAAFAYDSSACMFLSQCYENGTYGKQKSENLALEWRSKALTPDRRKFKEYTQPIDVDQELPSRG